ncbi:MAG: SH3 domain-containing protein [Clostridia bacterium]|nr:SH3 domain-containing protein [Clostridia bacterium]
MNRKLLSLVLALALVLGLAAAFAESGIGTAVTNTNSFSYLDESVMTMYVYTDNGQGLNVRSTPYVGNNIIGLAPYGSKLSVIRFLDNGWACIKWQKIGEAYVQSRFLQWFEPAPLVPVTPTPIPTAVPTVAPTSAPYVLPAYTDTMAELNKEFRTARLITPFVVQVRPSRASGWVNMRWAPSKDAEVLATYRSGAQLTVIAETQNWYQVADPNTEATGFMMKNYVVRQY